MARQLAWVFAALLLVPASGSAGTFCDRDQSKAQRASQTTQKSGERKPDGDRKADGDRKPDQAPVKWWMDPKLRAELSITDQQSALIEAIWQKDLIKRGESRQRAEKLDAELNKMILDGAEETLVIAQIEVLVALRGVNDKNRLMMLYRMNKVLTPDQRTKVDAMYKAMRAQRDNGGRRDSSKSK